MESSTLRKGIRKALATTAMAGLLAGTIGSVGGCHNGDKDKDQASDKHACKGQNSCKGKGNCKTAEHACKGQNSCKGQGGCKSSCKSSSSCKS
jgi:hypothetical protein